MTGVVMVPLEKGSETLVLATVFVVAISTSLSRQNRARGLVAGTANGMSYRLKWPDFPSLHSFRTGIIADATAQGRLAGLQTRRTDGVEVRRHFPVQCRQPPSRGTSGSMADQLSQQVGG